MHTEHIVRGGDRVGIYFLETGASMRPSKVIYDRANSAIAEADVAEFNFDEIMKDSDWFHFSGITPAISKNGAEITKAACIAAKKHGVKAVSYTHLFLIISHKNYCAIKDSQHKKHLPCIFKLYHKSIE